MPWNKKSRKKGTTQSGSNLITQTPAPTHTQDTPTSTTPTPRPVPDTNRTRDDVSTTEMSLNKEYAAALETKQTTLGKTSTRFRNPVTAVPITRPAQSLDQEYDQDGDTKGVSEGEETTDDDIPWENHERCNTLKVETASHAEFNVPDQTRGRH